VVRKFGLDQDRPLRGTPAGAPGNLGEQREQVL
jgi:hypothetical protein